MKALKLAIKKRLTDDDSYIALMGTPGAEPFQTYWFKPPVKPTFPETVLNINPSTSDQSSDPSFLITNSVLSINVWTKDDVYEDIIKRVIQLLNQKPDTAITGFRAILVSEPEDLFDDEFNVYGKNVMFNVHYRRALL